MDTGSLPRVESGRSVTLIPHPLPVPRYKKESRTIPLLTLRAFVACKKVENLFSENRSVYEIMWKIRYGKDLLGSIKMRGISSLAANTGQLLKKNSAPWSK
jgi:hypothetical protein